MYVANTLFENGKGPAWTLRLDLQNSGKIASCLSHATHPADGVYLRQLLSYVSLAGIPLLQMLRLEMFSSLPALAPWL